MGNMKASISKKLSESVREGIIVDLKNLNNPSP